MDHQSYQYYTEENSTAPVLIHVPEGGNAFPLLLSHLERVGNLRQEHEEKLRAFLKEMAEKPRLSAVCVETDARRWFQLENIPVGRDAALVMRDVTYARSRQILGRACEDKWELLSRSPGLCLCVADLTDGEVLYCCPWEELEGSGFEQTLRRMSAQLIDPRDREEFHRAFSSSVLLSTEEKQLDLTLRSAPGWDAVEYIGIRADMLRDSFSGNLCTCLVLTDRKSLREQEDRTQDLDIVTGAYNRAAFQRRFSERQEGGVLAAVRVNRMEQINDVLGTRRGDQILREMARTLSALLREGEILGRFRGAEFLICLNGGSEELLRERLSIICTVLTRELEENMKMSVHVGAMPMGVGENNFYDLYENAQLALRSIPEQGESTYAFFSPEMRRRANRMRLSLPRRPEEECRVFIRTFGYFEVFVDGTPLRFQGSQAKELMALLVDRRGGYLSSPEAITYLWEDEPANRLTLTRLRKVAMHLKRSLEEAGVSDIIEFRGSMRRIIPERVRCDYYDFLLREGEKSFPGNYMANYSWAESTLAELVE